MWLLVSERGESFLLTPREEHIVSRRGGTITLCDDQSISRQHAKLLLDNDDSNCDCGIILVDTSSKYGTYVNDGIEASNRITANEKILLKQNDVIRFGLQWNKWRVVFMPLIVTTSTLNQPEKEQVKLQVDKLGGKLLSRWSSQCTHLTMNQITLTIKAVSALGAGQYIVSPKYWQNLLLSIETKQGTLPDPNDCIPPLNEATLNENRVSFKVNKQRSTLFKSLRFVATTPRQKIRIEPMITAAGGNVVDFDYCSSSNEDFCKEGIILMQPSFIASSQNNESQVPATYNNLAEYLVSKGVRCIPESDIGLAIVYCSCEKFCNPRYNPQNVFLRRQPAPAQQTESLPVIIPETQDNSTVRLSGLGKETNESDVNTISPLTGICNKRPSTDADEEEKRLFKKPLISKDNIQILEDIVCNKKESLLETAENDVFLFNNEITKDNQQDDVLDKNKLTRDDKVKCSTSKEASDIFLSGAFKNQNSEKQTVSDDNDENNGDEFQLSSQRKFTKRCVKDDEQEKKLINNELKNKNIKKPIIISDSDDDSNDEPCQPNQRKRACGDAEGVKENEKNIKVKSYSEKDKTSEITNVCCNEDEEIEFCFPSEKKQLSKESSNLLDSEQDIFDRSHKTNDFKVPASVDMFACSRSLSSNIKEIGNNSSICSSKRSGDIFDTSNTSSKRSKGNNKEDEDDHFEFSSVNNRKNDDAKENDDIFKTPKSGDLMNDVPRENLFLSDKLSQDVFEASTSDNRGVKRRISIEEPPTKKLPVLNKESNETGQSSSSKIFSASILTKEEIKKEPIDATIYDKEIHDSTVVIMKSLIVPLRNVTLSKENKKNNSSVNFKKFRKATALKMPEFVDLVPYKETNNRCWANETTVSHSDDSSDEGDCGWSFQQSQAVKQSKNKSRKVK